MAAAEKPTEKEIDIYGSLGKRRDELQAEIEAIDKQRRPLAAKIKAWLLGLKNRNRTVGGWKCLITYGRVTVSWKEHFIRTNSEQAAEEILAAAPRAEKLEVVPA